MKEIVGDIHIHTCLSPCAENEMSPRAVVERALEEGLDMIAICDHNSGENVRSAILAAEGTRLRLVPGMEITTREEAHVLGLFPDEQKLSRVQEGVYSRLRGENDPEKFGDQLVMDDKDRIVRKNEKLLIGATDLSLESVVRMIHDAQGTAVAAHIDRPSFSVTSQLGFIPGHLGLDGVEICGSDDPKIHHRHTTVWSSDAHRLAEIGMRRTRFLVEDGTQQEISMALGSLNGRKVLGRV